MLSREPIGSLKGIGEKTAKLYEKLGIFTVGDLISYYPRSYEIYGLPVPIGSLKEDTVWAVSSILTKAPDLVRFNRMQMVSAHIKDLTGSLQLCWYNMPYMRQNLKPGVPYVFRGRVVRKRGRLVMEQPEVFSLEDYKELAPSMQPIYGQTKGLSNKAIVKAQRQALAGRVLEREYMPESIRKAHQLAEINYAVEQIHFPEDQNQLFFARKRLVFDEFFFFLIGVRRLKEARKDQKSDYRMKPVPQVLKFQESLPYELTEAQKRAWKEIEGDLKSGLVMNRLVQGDVGSGKTIIALLALLPKSEAMHAAVQPEGKGSGRRIALFAALGGVCLLCIAKLLPPLAAAGLTLAVLLIADRPLLKKLDYALLATFVAFFVFIGNMGRLPAFSAFLAGALAGREVEVAVAASQVISNVPAALLLAGYSENWPALIIGCDLGGLGTLIASMASLISYKFFARRYPAQKGRYLLWFTLANVGLLALLMVLYYIIR